MSVIWKKTFRDLARNKSRTVLAVLSTAVGIFALGLVINMSDMMNNSIRGSMVDSVPPNLVLYASPVDEAMLAVIRHQAGVASAEAAMDGFVHWKLAEGDQWQSASVIGRADFSKQQLSVLDLTAGVWPAKDTLAVEQATMSYFGLKPGDRILIEHGNTTRSVEITGTVRSIQVIPPQYSGGQGAFFATPDTVEWLTGVSNYNEAMIRIEPWDKARAGQLGNQLVKQFESAGVEVGGFSVEDPTRHYSQTILDGIMIVLTGMGIISLGLSAFLIVNTINALLAQQIWQIGIFKVIGATVGRVTGIYLGVAFLYGVLALLVALPASTFGAYFMSHLMLDTINIPGGPMRFVPLAFILQIGVGLVVPVLAALVPVIGGARVSCREAISNYGLGGGFGNSVFDRLIFKVQRGLPLLRSIPNPIVLSLRNTFRRKARVALTLATLTLAGVMFIMVMGVDRSMHQMLDVVLNDFGFDVLMSFDRPERTGKITAIAEAVPGVDSAEAWDIRVANIKLADGGDRQTQIWALPPDSNMFNFNITAGRSLLPEDGRAILVNRKIAQEEGLQVGDTITLNIDGKESDWTIVGLILNMNDGQQDCFVPLASFSREVGSLNRTGAIAIRLTAHNAQNEQAMIDALGAEFRAQGLNPTQITGVSMVKQSNEYQFRLLVNILLTMAVLAALVGCLGLAGTMSINVIERGREIGLMRSIGAASPSIAGIFLGEGLLLGIISWMLSIPLSIPGGMLFTRALSAAIMPMDYAFSIQGVFTWLLIVGVLSVLAVLWPALRATRVSVRESLAYE
jgi:putative ABC transport system permease protein